MERLPDGVLENAIGCYETMQQIEDGSVDVLQQVTLRLLKELKEYKDIGPTPEQLLEIDKMYSDKCREVAELKWQLETKVEGDLISRMALLKRLKDYTEQVYECDFDDESCTAPEMSENPQIVEGLWEAREIIEDMPTAYDVEKVVERMEQAKYSEDDATSDNELLNFNYGVDECIGILKAGGADE